MNSIASPELNAARGLVPYLDGEEMGPPGEYLAFRLVGFTSTEALTLVGKKMKNLNQWRLKIEGFKMAEHMCTGANKGELRKELLQTMFTRNFMLNMKKDQELFLRAAGLWEEEIQYMDADGVEKTITIHPGLDTDELKDQWAVARRSYTPQQLAAIEKVTSGQSEGIDIHGLILNMQKNEVHHHYGS